MQYTVFHSQKIDVSVQTLSGNAFNIFWPFNFGVKHADDHTLIFLWTKQLGGISFQIHRWKIKTSNTAINFKIFQE